MLRIYLTFAIVAFLSNSAICLNDTTTTTTNSTPVTSNTTPLTNTTITTTKVLTTTTLQPTTVKTTIKTTEAVPKLSATCALNQASPFEKSLLSKVLALDKKKFTWSDKDHLYYIGVCTEADNAKNVDEAFIQINKETKKQVVLGRLNDVDLEGFGTESKGIRVHYKNGDNYANACNKAERQSILYILCNPNNSSDLFEMIEENNDHEDNTCSYVFQLRTPLMCNPTPNNNSSSTTNMPITTNMPTSTTTTANGTSGNSTSKWGFVSVILLVMFGVLCVYFLVGTMYMRYVKQARGFEQLPNHEIWQTIGMRSADCCNYVCRCGKVSSEIRNYEHISDRLSDDDENLLNM